MPCHGRAIMEINDNIFNEDTSDEEEVVAFAADNGANVLQENSSSIIYPQSMDDIPTPVKQRAFLLLILGGIVCLVILIAHILVPNFNYLGMLLVSLILCAYGATHAFIILKGTHKFGYIRLVGSIVNIYPAKFDKKTFTVQMYDEEKEIYMAFKYSGGKEIAPGVPVSLYLTPSEPIKSDAELGNLVESYLAVVFTTDETLSGSTKSAKDLLKTNSESD